MHQVYVTSTFIEYCVLLTVKYIAPYLALTILIHFHSAKEPVEGRLGHKVPPSGPGVMKGRKRQDRRGKAWPKVVRFTDHTEARSVKIKVCGRRASIPL